MINQNYISNSSFIQLVRNQSRSGCGEMTEIKFLLKSRSESIGQLKVKEIGNHIHDFRTQNKSQKLRNEIQFEKFK